MSSFLESQTCSVHVFIEERSLSSMCAFLNGVKNKNFWLSLGVNFWEQSFDMMCWCVMVIVVLILIVFDNAVS